jgi:hypothetical protein
MALFFSKYGLLLVVALVGALLSPKRLIAPLVMGAAITGYFFFPDHIMGIYLRFVYPVLPLAAWLAMNALHQGIRQRLIPSFLLIIGMPLVVVVLIYGTATEHITVINPSNKASQSQETSVVDWTFLPVLDREWQSTYVWVNDYTESEYRSLIPFGMAIGRARELGQKPMSVAMVDLGAVAYYGDWPMLDLFGLTHPKLALARSRGEYSAELLLAEKPDIVLLGEFYKEPVYRGQFPFERELYTQMPSHGYVPAVRFIWNRVFGFLVFTRNEEIKDRLAGILRTSPPIVNSLQVFDSGANQYALPLHPWARQSR